MLMQSRKRNSLMCLLLVVSSAILYAPDEEDPLLVNNSDARYKYTKKRIGAVALCVLFVAGAPIGLCFGIKDLVSQPPSDNTPTPPPCPGVDWNRENSSCEGVPRLQWAVIECQAHLLEKENSCFPVCQVPKSGKVVKSWWGSKNVDKFCAQYLPEDAFAVMCKPDKLNWAVEQLDKAGVKYCIIPSEGLCIEGYCGETIFVIPKDQMKEVVAIDEYHEISQDPDLMEKYCGGIVKMVTSRSIPGTEPCTGSFTCGYGHDSCNKSKPRKNGATKGEKNTKKAARNKNKRGKRSS